tara:strand:- start:11509 stop:11769 length:261 start_codon:yes stop_codon:yes gene_type:complete
MIKKIRLPFIVLLGIILIFLTIPLQSQAEFSSMDEKEVTINIQEPNKDLDIDKILGPEENFPFLPENHRDNSNPIGRIGSINGEDF